MITDDEFDMLITRAMNELPQEYIENMQNVAIIMQDEPTLEQRQKLQLRGDSLLLGLFEGVPRPLQTGNEIALLPSKITLFKYHIAMAARSTDGFFEQVKRTLWHEIAHYYGLDHNRMNDLERSSKE